MYLSRFLTEHRVSGFNEESVSVLFVLYIETETCPTLEQGRRVSCTRYERSFLETAGFESFAAWGFRQLEIDRKINSQNVSRRRHIRKPAAVW